MWGGTFTLIIENKVDAEEQPDQCDDLYENFRNEVAPLFDGRPPALHGESGERGFMVAGGAHGWEAAVDEPRNATTVSDAGDVVRNYLRTLKEQFG